MCVLGIQTETLCQIRVAFTKNKEKNAQMNIYTQLKLYFWCGQGHWEKGAKGETFLLGESRWGYSVFEFYAMSLHTGGEQNCL